MISTSRRAVALLNLALSLSESASNDNRAAELSRDDRPVYDMFIADAWAKRLMVEAARAKLAALVADED